MRMRDRMDRMIRQRDRQDLREGIVDIQRDFWMSAEEAIDYGIVSRIVETHRDLK